MQRTPRRLFNNYNNLQLTNVTSNQVISLVPKLVEISVEEREAALSLLNVVRRGWSIHLTIPQKLGYAMKFNFVTTSYPATQS